MVEWLTVSVLRLARHNWPKLTARSQTRARIRARPVRPLPTAPTRLGLAPFCCYQPPNPFKMGKLSMPVLTQVSGTQSCTRGWPCWQLLIVNGPVRERLSRLQPVWVANPFYPNPASAYLGKIIVIASSFLLGAVSTNLQSSGLHLTRNQTDRRSPHTLPPPAAVRPRPLLCTSARPPPRVSVLLPLGGRSRNAVAVHRDPDCRSAFAYVLLGPDRRPNLGTSGPSPHLSHRTSSASRQAADGGRSGLVTLDRVK